MPFASKSEERRVKALKRTLEADPKGLDADIKIFPVQGQGFGVSAAVDGKPLKSKLCPDKAAIITFLTEVL